MTEKHNTDVHVYEVTRDYGGGLVFARAEPEEMRDHLAHLGTIEEFTEEVKAGLGEYDGGTWFTPDSETVTYHYNE